jgi:isochorismate pyruvate lyase
LVAAVIKVSSPKAIAALSELRRQMDDFDSELVVLLARRQRCIERVSEFKRAERLPARTPECIEEVLERLRGLAEAHKLESDLAVALWREMTRAIHRL